MLKILIGTAVGAIVLCVLCSVKVGKAADRDMERMMKPRMRQGSKE